MTPEISPLFSFDLALFRWINLRGTSPWLDAVMAPASWTALLWAAGVGTVLALLMTRRFRLLAVAACILLAVGATNITRDLLKDAVGRVRPLNALDEVRFEEDDGFVLRHERTEPPKERGTSFPSSHAANTMAIAVCLIGLWPLSRAGRRPRSRWLVLLLPLLVGYSRIYLGKHYPSDVLGGWLVGATFATGIALAAGRILPRFGLHFSAAARSER